MNCTASCLADLGLTPTHLMQLAFSAFAAVLFIQSGLDKVFNWTSEKNFYKAHFSKSILKGSVFLLMPVITLVELSAGLLSAAGFFQVLLTGNTGTGTLGMLCAVAGLTMLFFGQRVAKDYKGAAVLVPYFLMAAGGLYVFLLY
ncbi:MAG: DoxX family protein [Flavobacteriales bacterium]